ncbi:MAG: OstA-like protein [Candidatus Pseudobacter hemicellulosilyticus]|uniref:OstA-like protein n=1 Tax=Candidatus Pseudobacter hemicellulosilyticus TaxID=3121375 RepID=A0AAJ5WS92_9BACT|nr:MAG: OstA-like protein [Pseudobacter sp.]
MNRYYYLTIVLFFASLYTSYAQSPASDSTAPQIVNWIYSDVFRSERKDSVTEVQTMVGKVHMAQGRTQFYCDSAIYNKRLRTVEAFGNVHINDADSVHTYSQYLLYHADTRIAFLRNKVKLTDNKITLTTEELRYDANEKIGDYYNGGKVVNGPTVLTSKEGTYYGELKDVYFKRNVVLNDPQYNLKGDSLLYNTTTEIATFIAPTTIRDSSNKDIYTTDGFYDLKNKKAYFGKRPIIHDGRTLIIANEVTTDDASGISLLKGNAVFVDSAQGVSVLANFIRANRNESSFFATQSPLMIIQQEKDSIYITADTLVSGKLSKLEKMMDSLRHVADSLRKLADTVSQEELTPGVPMPPRPATDSLIRSKDSIRTAVIAADSLNRSMDSLATMAVDSLVSGKDLRPQAAAKPPGIDSLLSVRDSMARVVQPAVDSLAAVRDSITNIQPPQPPARRPDSLAKRPQTPPVPGRRPDGQPAPPTMRPVQQDPLVKAPPPASKETDTLRGITVVDSASAPLSDSADRYFQAYHHVRIFSDSLQAVADSLFYSGRDSAFRLFTDPIIWSGDNQITGDTIYLYTKNKQPDRLFVFENALAVNKLTTGPNMYNQLKGNRLNGIFVDGAIDHFRSRGNAESVYYILDNDSALVGINKVQGDIIELRFKNKELFQVAVISEPSGTMLPVSQATEQDRFLRNFKWQEARRPKSKYELFGN